MQFWMWKSAYVGVYQLLNWRMHGETFVQYLIAKVKPLIAKQGTTLALSLFVALWICELAWDLPHTYEPIASRRRAEPHRRPWRAKPESAKSGSLHSTHGRVWLIGTRAQPDSQARLVRVWALTVSTLAEWHNAPTVSARNGIKTGVEADDKDRWLQMVYPLT